MKLRILNNSVRLRLSKDDMDRLYKEKKITSSCQLLNDTLHYSVVIDSKQTNINALMENNTILVLIPSHTFNKFYESTDEGLYNSHRGEAEELKIAVERDFRCLTPRDEDESILFPNPRESH